MQKISESSRLFAYLHDTSCFGIAHDKQQSHLIFKMKFLQQDDDSFPKGHITFYDVADIQSNHELEILDRWDTYGGVTDVDHIPERDKNNLEAVRWYMDIRDSEHAFPAKTIVLDFLSSGFEVEYDTWDWDEEE